MCRGKPPNLRIWTFLTRIEPRQIVSELQIIRNLRLDFETSQPYAESRPFASRISQQISSWLRLAIVIRPRSLEQGPRKPRVASVRWEIAAKSPNLAADHGA